MDRLGLLYNQAEMVKSELCQEKLMERHERETSDVHPFLCIQQSMGGGVGYGRIREGQNRINAWCGQDKKAMSATSEEIRVLQIWAHKLL